MSSASTTTSDHPRAGTADSDFGTALQYAATPVRFVGFWAAIALPFLYLPLLWEGLNGGNGVVFVGLLAVNLLALVAGRNYRRQ